VAQFPVTTAGTRITADLLGAMITNYTIKPADTVRASTTTVASDPDLVSGTLVAGGVYLVEFRIQIASLAIAGIKTQWLVPSGATGFKDVTGPASGATTNTNGDTSDLRWAVHGLTTAVPYTDVRNSLSLSVPVMERGMVTIGPTAGTVTLQWAQNASNATGSAVQASSWVAWRQVG
jgi:hypothetical protein